MQNVFVYSLILLLLNGLIVSADNSSKSSVNNKIENNNISSNTQYGIYLYGKSNENIINNNLLAQNDNAIYIKTTNNQALNNTLIKNNTGIYFLGDASANKISGNKITYSKLYGIYGKVTSGLSNYIDENNYIWRNKKNLVAEEIR